MSAPFSRPAGPDLSRVHELPLEQRVLAPILRERARIDRDRVYLRFGTRAWTFGETEALVWRLARGWRRLGIEKGERIGLFMTNRPEFVFSWFAANLVGGVTVPINAGFTPALLDYVLVDAGARALVTTRDLLPVVASLPAARRALLRAIVVIDPRADARDGHPPDSPGSDGIGTVVEFEALAATSGSEDPEVALDFRDTHSIMYTSGTTGPSKGAIVPNGHYFSASCTFLRAVDLQREDILFTPLPLFHGVASRLGALPCLLVGAEYVLAPRFSASRFWQQVTECRATVAHTIFTLPALLKGQPPGPWDRAHRLRAMYNSNHDPEFEQRFNVRLCEAYGLTEVGLTHYTRFPERRPGSCGRTHEDWDAAVVDARGLPVADGETGEIVLRPRLPSIMMDGYINKPAETLRATRDLWFHTGDYGRRDSEGYFYFVSRAKERIRRRGENISPSEVEMIVGGHPAVADCAALAHPARDGEDDVRIVIVARDPAAPPAPPALMDWLQAKMPYFMMPRYIEFAAALPRNPAGKIEKYKLLDAGLAPDAWDREAAGHVIRRGTTPRHSTDQETS